MLGKDSEILAQTFSLPLSKTSGMEFLAPNEIVQKEVTAVFVGIAEGGARTRDLEVWIYQLIRATRSTD